MYKNSTYEFSVEGMESRGWSGVACFTNLNNVVIGGTQAYVAQGSRDIEASVFIYSLWEDSQPRGVSRRRFVSLGDRDRVLANFYARRTALLF